MYPKSLWFGCGLWEHTVVLGCVFVIFCIVCVYMLMILWMTVSDEFLIDFQIVHVCVWMLNSFWRYSEKPIHNVLLPIFVHDSNFFFFFKYCSSRIYHLGKKWSINLKNGELKEKEMALTAVASRQHFVLSLEFWLVGLAARWSFVVALRLFRCVYFCGTKVLFRNAYNYSRSVHSVFQLIESHHEHTKLSFWRLGRFSRPSSPSGKYNF